MREGRGGRGGRSRDDKERDQYHNEFDDGLPTAMNVFNAFTGGDDKMSYD